jgi:fructokinase
VGIGETVFDILFKNNSPVGAVPGGSVYNSIVSLGRAGVPAAFVSEVGNDRVGNLIVEHLRDSGVDTSAVCCFDDGKSPLSLAFLNEQGDADYLFYKDYPANRLAVEFPQLGQGDILLFGSYFVLNPVLRSKVKPFLQKAKESGATLYYDINFRRNHIHERDSLLPSIIENMELATIVRGSADDFRYLFDCTDGAEIYRSHIAPHCKNFIFTSGGGPVTLFTPSFTAQYAVPQVEVRSTVGAGDNFNAGVVYGLWRHGICSAAVASLERPVWDTIVHCGLSFSARACTLLDNYVDKEWAAGFVQKEL